MTTQVKRKVRTVSVSMPPRLISETDEIAAARKLSRSRLITKCINEMVQKEKRKLMTEGYKAMAAENRRLAKGFLPTTIEEWPEWED